MLKGPNLCLVGFMATGKTTVGKILAQELQWRFSDSDREIELCTGLSIPALFAYYGEEYFRYLEGAALKELTAGRNQVIATGGGAVLNPLNRTLLKRAGPVVWLRAAAETILARTEHSHDRPLLETTDPKERVGELLAQRTSAYAAVCDWAIDVDGLAPNDIAVRIIGWLRADRTKCVGRG